MERKTNREMAKTDAVFRAACERAGVFPSRNQYIKFKHGRGVAFQAKQQGIRDVVFADMRNTLDNGDVKDIAL